MTDHTIAIVSLWTAICSAVVTLAVSLAALVVAIKANGEERRSRNVDALLSIHSRSMSPDMARIRGELLYGSRYDVFTNLSPGRGGLADAEFDKRREELHGLLGLYEGLATATRRGLLGESLVKAMFPQSIPKGFLKTKGYIEDYRKTANHKDFAENLAWLAERY
ncbi:hypothetical protein [Mycobacterium sp. E3339]|uniref:DUF4760 domain-containing protein n=1 Tax=Mycobacterium sp. E3339 TaxID=1834146 RepID=UPI0012E76E6D|nr:hypothetical protein [Mycobacterium sp. E3339]